MSLSDSAGLVWLRRRVGGLTAAAIAWLLLHFLASAALVGEALLLVLNRDHLALGVQVLLWAQWLVLGSAYLVVAFKLFGPVLFYDLIRMARRGRFILVRCLYAFGLLLLLSWVFFAWSVDRGPGLNLRPNQMANFAMSFFYMFMVVQFLVMLVLTPAYTAGAMADEKNRRTLDFLLATDLRQREIVLSKLMARLANLGIIVITGLPILSILQLLGGVDPLQLLAGYVATSMTVLSLASVSILFSTVSRRPSDAIVFTYLSLPAYIILCYLSSLFVTSLELNNFPSTADWISPVTLQDLVDWLNAGNIIAAYIKLTPPLDQSLPGPLRDYALFHGLVAVACTGFAATRLRAIALRENSARARRRRSPILGLRDRPPVGDAPMIWKEVFAEPRFRIHWLGRVLIGVVVVASFIPVVFIVVECLFYDLSGNWRSSRWEELSQSMNIWVRSMGTIVACLTLLAVAIRAASSISGERDRQTFDSLLTSPLSSDAMLFGKWIGSILGLRWSWVWMGAIWLLGIITGGMHPAAVPLLLLAWLIFAAMLASLGVWFSAVSRTTLRATIWTLVCALGLWFGHWVIWMCCLPVLFAGRLSAWDGLRWVAEFQAFGLTPPVTLGFLAFRGEDFEPKHWSQRQEFFEFLTCSVIGLVVWAVGSLVLWGATSSRFRVMTGRAHLRRPKRRGGRYCPQVDALLLEADHDNSSAVPAAETSSQSEKLSPGNDSTPPVGGSP